MNCYKHNTRQNGLQVLWDGGGNYYDYGALSNILDMNYIKSSCFKTARNTPILEGEEGDRIVLKSERAVKGIQVSGREKPLHR